jgi:hypothetical protein
MRQPSNPSERTSSSTRFNLSGSVAQHHIGTHKAQPAFDIVAVARQPFGEGRHHTANHFRALLRGEVSRRRNVGFGRSF